MAESFQAGSAGDKFRAAAEARVAYLTNTTEVSSPEATQEYMRVYDEAMKFGGMDMHTIILPRVNPDTLLFFDDEHLRSFHEFMGRVALETAPSGLHMPFSQRQQYTSGLHTLRSQERRSAVIEIGAKAGGLAVIGLAQDSTMSAHYADTLAVLGSGWDGSWTNADLTSVALNGAAVRCLRALAGDTPQLAKMQEHKLIGPSFDRVAEIEKDGLVVEEASLATATSIVGVNEYEWLEHAHKGTGLSSIALMGIAAEVYGGRMRLRGSRNWMRLQAFYKTLTMPPAPHEVAPSALESIAMA